MERYYWVATCPLCRQGRLILQRNDTSRALYAHCEDCEQGYHGPADIDASQGFLTLGLDDETSNPSLSEIEGSAWRGKIKGSFEP